jgi:hypothetical protein
MDTGLPKSRPGWIADALCRIGHLLFGKHFVHHPEIIVAPELFILAALFKRKYIIAFTVAMILGAIGTGYFLNWIA